MWSQLRVNRRHSPSKASRPAAPIYIENNDTDMIDSLSEPPLINESKASGSSAKTNRKVVSPRNSRSTSPSSGRSSPKFAITETQLRCAFAMLDTNRDGSVDAIELKQMLASLRIHLNDDLIDTLIQDASDKGNGRISEDEFISWMERITGVALTVSALKASKDPKTLEDPIALAQEDNNNTTESDLQAAFRVFDRDQNGYITRDELKYAMEMMGETMTEAELDNLLRIADLDRDGRIDFEEFKTIMTLL